MQGRRVGERGGREEEGGEGAGKGGRRPVEGSTMMKKKKINKRRGRKRGCKLAGRRFQAATTPPGNPGLNSAATAAPPVSVRASAIRLISMLLKVPTGRLRFFPFSLLIL